MENNNDLGFLETDESQVDLDSIKVLGEKCRILKEKRKDIAQMELQLDNLNKEEQALSREEIPNLLLQTGLTEIKLESGEKVTIQEKLACSLPKKDLEKKKKVFNFIIEQGGEHIIKRILSVEDPEEFIINFLQENKIPFSDEKSIHASTLKSWFSQKLGMKKNSLQEIELQDIPKEANVFTYKETNIK